MLFITVKKRFEHSRNFELKFYLLQNNNQKNLITRSAIFPKNDGCVVGTGVVVLTVNMFIKPCANDENGLVSLDCLNFCFSEH